ncbi:IS3 family transposase [Pseudobythopirellula maris]|uniref:IS3 family transposase n=1 Tax=Pseudobythopirellula maris TaxID=2527991 RepID=UPI0018D31B30|nr:IS3 family transposase [Pseudobythopirellula maris]
MLDEPPWRLLRSAEGGRGGRIFWSIKHEGTNWRSYTTMEDARLSVFKYIETFYNPRRRRQTLGYKSPDQFEAEHATTHAA